MQQAHPGWLIFHNSGTGAWSAYRRTFPDKQEIAAGVRLLIRADSAERLEGKLAAQAEILPAPEPLPGISWTFLRS
ncbi:hypothetical protein AB0395_00485 [Streptosporangium sp. NPDC051023]|uniref:hypothetical protein n=1 Tax=Streptosporangium sp. NPDC051023 TaxID=3155410 RepID=UPI00344ED668